jgi:hypothetical protein
MSLLKYYIDKGISPVNYYAKNTNEHLVRRKSLYNMLGIPSIAIRNSRILEIAAGSGQNSLYISAEHPREFVIVEPNPAALEQISANFTGLPPNYILPTVLPLRVEDFKPPSNFDIVICENWLGSSNDEINLLNRISDYVSSNGILIITILSIVGWLPNLLRHLLLNSLIDSYKIELSYTDKFEIALSAFEKHLATLSSMTRSKEDWIRDNMINPTYLDQGLTLELVLNNLQSNGFSVLGTAPQFYSEWRWFKQLDIDPVSKNIAALNAQDLNNFMFLDYRHTQNNSPGNNFDCKKLEHRCKDILISMQLNLNKKIMLKKISELNPIFQSFFPNLSSSLMEVLQLLSQDSITIEDIASMKNFKSWFGRETLYLSLERR